jgi:hypothetical protein
VSGAGLAPFLAMPQVKAMIFAEMQATAKTAKVFDTHHPYDMIYEDVLTWCWCWCRMIIVTWF